MTRSREVSKGATRQEFVYTATSQQTTFSGNDDSSNSLSYTAGQIDVFVNGVRQAAADYTATNGTSVVLGAGASAGDTVNINAFGSFSVADVIVARAEFDYTATAGQTTFTGSDNDSQTMAYTAGRIDVYLNGSHLNVTDDYVATNGTSVVLEAGAQAGDSLVVISHGTVNLAANIVAGDLDLNGNELILDVDGDTSITADTDDQIDFKTGGTDRMQITANGTTLIQSSAEYSDGSIGNACLQLDSRAGARTGMALRAKNTDGSAFVTSNQGMIGFVNGNGTVGTINTNGTATAYNTSSDYRLKENVDYTFDATTRLKQLKPARFNFKTDTDTTLDGFLAHEVSSIVPEAVTGTKDAKDDDDKPIYQGIDQSKLVPLLVKTIQELEARIKTLEDA